MFEDEQSLPLSQVKLAIGDRDVFTGPGDSCSQVGGHVVGALFGVGVGGIVFGCKPFKPVFKVSSCCRVGVFGDDQARTCVSEKN